MIEPVTIGRATLYLGDACKMLKGFRADAVVTDPPYGIGEDGGSRRPSGSSGRVTQKHERLGWDNARPSAEMFEIIKECAPVWFICGGNYFADLLPPSMGWLYWDKRLGGDFSDGELIYTNRKAALRAFSAHAFEGLRGGRDREHPTQKPLSLMMWCLEFIPDAQTILDPYMGSGTTGVAAIQMGRNFIGMEREPKYFEIACRRIREAVGEDQGPLYQSVVRSMRARRSKSGTPKLQYRHQGSASK